jgi:hypothetical protein
MAMITYFTHKDLIDFGNYLLSEERRELYESHPLSDSMPSLEERLSQVSHADVENFIKKSQETCQEAEAQFFTHGN